MYKFQALSSLASHHTSMQGHRPVSSKLHRIMPAMAQDLHRMSKTELAEKVCYELSGQHGSSGENSTGAERLNQEIPVLDQASSPDRAERAPQQVQQQVEGQGLAKWGVPLGEPDDTGMVTPPTYIGPNFHRSSLSGNVKPESSNAHLRGGSGNSGRYSLSDDDLGYINEELRTIEAAQANEDELEQGKKGNEKKQKRDAFAEALEAWHSSHERDQHERPKPDLELHPTIVKAFTTSFEEDCKRQDGDTAAEALVERSEERQNEHQPLEHSSHALAGWSDPMMYWEWEAGPTEKPARGEFKASTITTKEEPSQAEEGCDDEKHPSSR